MNKVDLEEKQERRMRYGFLALLLLVLGGIHFMDPAFYPTVYQLSKSGDLGGTITYLRGFGVYAVFVSFFIDVVINIVGFLPSIFISTANGLIFGLFWGTMISWLAETLGVMISFWVMRVLFRSLAKRVKIGRIPTILGRRWRQRERFLICPMALSQQSVLYPACHFALIWRVVCLVSCRQWHLR